MAQNLNYYAKLLKGGYTPEDNTTDLAKSLRQSGDASVSGNRLDDSGDFFSVGANGEIKIDNYMKIMPYRFSLLSAEEDPLTKAIDYRIPSTGSVFTLPINPSNLNIAMPMAAQTTVLADGILVESNGAPIRYISIQGTTGFLPFRDVNAQSAPPGGFATAGAVQSVAAAAQAFRDNKPVRDRVVSTSGYTQFHMLYRFFESWAFLSKQPENRNLRLAFDMAKDNITYLVTPKSFSLSRSAENPMEYRYAIQLEAWKKIKIGGIGFGFPPVDPINVNVLTSALEAIQKVRRIIAAASGFVKAIQRDVAAIANVLRVAALAIKAALGVVASLIDLPHKLIVSLTGAIAESFDAVFDGVSQVLTSASNIKSNFAELGETVRAQFAAVGNEKTGYPFKSLAQKDPSNQLQVNSTQGGQAISTDGGNNAGGISESGSDPSKDTNKLDDPASPLSSIIQDPDSNFDILEQATLDRLRAIPPELRAQIDLEIKNARVADRAFFEDVRSKLNLLSRDLATAFGQGSEVYDLAKGIKASRIPVLNKKITRDELDVLFAVRDAAAAMDAMILRNNRRDSAVAESFNYVGRLAREAGIPFQGSQGKYAAPVPFGLNLAQIANFYLGDPSRESELATLNGLLPPFIDEEGESRSFLANANVNQFMVNDVPDLLSGQKVILSSSSVVPFSRKITDINRLDNSTYLITVDGNPDLDKLSTADGAKMVFYKPMTVNSSDLIYIPTNTVLPSDLPERLKPIEFFPDVDGLQKLSGIDFLLTQGNDIAINSKGEIGLAGGLTNLIQALRIKAITPRGSLIRHPLFGFGIEPGTAITDVELNDLKEVAVESIRSDKRFGDMTEIQLEFAKNALKINGVTNLAGNNNLLPFDLDIT